MKVIPLSSVRSQKDVSQYAGAIVAYETDINYFSITGEGYPISDSDPQLKFGLVSKFPHGYELKQLLRPDEVPSCKALINPKIAEGVLLMRLATIREQHGIRKAVLTKKAEFDYTKGLPAELK